MHIKIPEQILNELERIKNAEGYMLTGSRVLGKISKNSDWDFFVLLKKGVARWRKTWLVDNEWLEVFCNNEVQIKKYFKEDLKGGRGVNIFMFVTGKIVKDSPKRTMLHLIMRARHLWQMGPNRLTKKDRQMIDYNIATAIQDVEDLLHDNSGDMFLINQTVNDFIKHYYRLKNIWLPRHKEILHDFSKREKELTKLIDRINRANNWKEKSYLAIQLGQRIGKKFGLSLDGCLYLPPEKNSKQEKAS